MKEIKEKLEKLEIVLKDVPEGAPLSRILEILQDIAYEVGYIQDELNKVKPECKDNQMW